jgi:hypothetical protein
MPEIERSFGDTGFARTMRALGALLIGAFAGAIVGTPTITGFAAVPDFGAFTAIDAAVGAFLFLTGMRLLQSNGPRGQIWLGGVLVGGVTGAFVGAMIPWMGPVILGVVVAVLFGSFVIWSPYREDPRAGIAWTLASALLVGLFFFALASLFPIVQRHHAMGYGVALIAVGGPCGIMGLVGGLIFARQTGSRKRLTLLATGLMALVALVPFLLYHAPVRTIEFPTDRVAGTIRYSHWFEFRGVPAQGPVRVPMRGVIYLQLDQGAGEDLSFFEDMPGLRELDMTGLPIDDATVAQLAPLTHLTFLSLANTPITDDALAPLSGLRRLERLELGGTNITGEGLAHLVDLPSLARLNIERTSVTDEAMQHVAAMPALRELSLFTTATGDGALVHLAAAPKLEWLELYMTRVTRDGIEAFREKRPDCEVLH